MLTARQGSDARVIAALAAGDGANDEKWLLARGDVFGQGRVGRFVGQIFLAGEEAQKGAALLRVVVADGAAQHRITGFERIEHGALRHGGGDFERHFAVSMRQRSQMSRQNPRGSWQASALRRKALPGDRARSASSYRRHRPKRTPARRWCRNRRRRNRANRRPSRRAARSRSNRFAAGLWSAAPTRCRRCGCGRRAACRRAESARESLLIGTT